MTILPRVFLAGAAACALALPVSAQDPDTVLATVNGTDITLGHMIALQKRLPQEYRQLEDDVLYDGMLEQLIQQTALSQEMEKDTSKANALALENEMRAYLAGQYLETVGTREIAEDAIKAAYDAQFANAEPESEFSAAHILVASEEEAKAIVEELGGGADFAELAKEKSTGPSGPRGGDLGWFSAGMMVPEFEAAVVELEDGAISEPVQTQFGWHVIKRNGTRDKAIPGLEQVRSEIENRLRSEAIEAALASVTDGAEITRNEVEIDPSVIRDESLIEK